MDDFSNRLKKDNNYIFTLSNNRKRSRNFIVKLHYSKSCPYTEFFFDLLYGLDLVGSAALGQVIGRFQSKKYWPDNPDKLIELRRLVLIDNTLKNTESFFISKIFKYLRNNTSYEAVLSLADPNFGHDGTIYKATNFIEIGKDMDTRDRIFIDGKEYHPRSLYSMLGTSSTKFLKEHFKNRVEFKPKKPKIVYIYPLNKKQRKTYKKVYIK